MKTQDICILSYSGWWRKFGSLFAGENFIAKSSRLLLLSSLGHDIRPMLLEGGLVGETFYSENIPIHPLNIGLLFKKGGKVGKMEERDAVIVHMARF